MPPEPPKPTEHELAALHSISESRHLSAMPVTFNGKERFALVIIRTGPMGPFVQIVGILPRSDDEFVAPDGNKSVTTNELPSSTKLN